MATTQEIAQNTAALALGHALLLAKGNMRLCALHFQDKPLTFKIGEGLQSTTVAFEPSVFQGTGLETRKGTLFRITEDDFNAISAMEEWCRDALRPTNPNVDALWSAAARKSDKWGCQLKAKINLSGGGFTWQTKFYDEDKKLCEPPEEWRGLCVSVVLVV